MNIIAECEIYNKFFVDWAFLTGNTKNVTCRV